MKIYGFLIVLLGVVIAYIGITGSQHRVMAVLMSIHLNTAGSSSSNTQTGGIEGSAGPVNQGGATSPQVSRTQFSQ